MMKYFAQAFKNIFWILVFIITGRILFLLICSYSHNYDDTLWQPYQIGDSLEFYSNNGDSVFWIISEISKGSASSDPLNPLSNRRYDSFVSIRNNYSILHIYELEDKNIYFEPFFYKRDGICVVENEENIEYLDYNNIKITRLVPRSEDYTPFLKEIYWSSSFGYIKVFYKNGDWWELNSYIRNGRVLYKHTN